MIKMVAQLVLFISSSILLVQSGFSDRDLIARILPREYSSRLLSDRSCVAESTAPTLFVSSYHFKRRKTNLVIDSFRILGWENKILGK